MLFLTVCRKAFSRSYGVSVSPGIGPRSLLRTSAASRPGAHARYRGARLGILAAVGVVCGSGYICWKRDRLDGNGGGQNARQQHSRRQTPMASLLRSYVVYSMCSIPLLVDRSPFILSIVLSVPGINYLADAFVRATFFSQFVGGETALDTLPVLSKLREENKGTLLAYSVEGDEDEAVGKGKARGLESDNTQPMHKYIVDEVIRCIDVAADFEDRLGEDRKDAAISTGRRTWVAIKLSALLPDAQTLINFSGHLVNTRPPPDRPVCFPGSPRPSDFDVLSVNPADLPGTSPLKEEDLSILKELRVDLFRICQRAKERGVKIIIDAEYSWYQPAIDAYQRALMAEFNKIPVRSRPSYFSKTLWRGSRGTSVDLRQSPPLVQPLIYGTFQAYLRRTPEYLAQSILDAEAGHYKLGVKLVRGAYHPFEVSAHETRKLVESKDSSAVGTDASLYCPSISLEETAPVWEDKVETDANYNACVRMLIKHVADDLAPDRTKEKRNWNGGDQCKGSRVGILFGTHNWESCGYILDALVNDGLATRSIEDGSEVIHIADDAAECVTLGQLYGTRDALTNFLVDKTRSTNPFVIKYVPYGKLSEVMPYLSRRAIENKSILGNGVAQEERREAGSEIVKRLWSLFG